MKKYVFLLPLLLWLGCQNDIFVAPDSVPGDLAYADNGAIKKRLYCNSARCDKPANEEQYEYNAAGQLTRINYLGLTTANKLELYGYTEYDYDQEGQLVSKIRYGKYAGAGFVPYDESDYHYEAGVLKSEDRYFNQKNPDVRVLTGLTEYIFKNGNKVEEKVYDAKKKLINRITFSYQKNVLTTETWYDADNKSIRLFEHMFKGHARQVNEYIPSSQERVAMIEKNYDAQGRLVSEETKVVNPLLCAMRPGLIRYEY
ncbi:hypothetical protein [Tellurirhabdus bombi]|uniref:hypothetical protein n=1 Tax=Tellurirhabdus bombi TaxID=2907205 RepID=UPI001F2C2C34|nr:hypothetical protein [Tellurirhabdus bombi]